MGPPITCYSRITTAALAGLLLFGAQDARAARQITFKGRIKNTTGARYHGLKAVITCVESLKSANPKPISVPVRGNTFSASLSFPAAARRMTAGRTC